MDLLQELYCLIVYIGTVSYICIIVTSLFLGNTLVLCAWVMIQGIPNGEHQVGLIHIPIWAYRSWCWDSRFKWHILYWFVDPLVIHVKVHWSLLNILVLHIICNIFQAFSLALDHCNPNTQSGTFSHFKHCIWLGSSWHHDVYCCDD